MLGTPYDVDSVLYVALLVGVLVWWRLSEGTLSVHSVTTARRERFYWATVLLTFGLGTALGDTTAIDLGLGFGWSIVLFGVLILVPLVLVAFGLNATIAFWASYVLTRPLGASVADWLGKAPSSGGLGWGDGTVFGLGPRAVRSARRLPDDHARRRRGRARDAPRRGPDRPGAGLRTGLSRGGRLTCHADPLASVVDAHERDLEARRGGTGERHPP